MKLNRKWILVMSLVLSVAMATSGTMAYLTSTDSDVNVMTLGNVKIEQNEQQRVEANGEFTSELEDFEDAKILMPVTYPDGRTADTVTVGDYTITLSDDEANYVDKIISATNTGSVDAYVRTLVAVPTGGADWESTPVAAANCWLHWNIPAGYDNYWTLISNNVPMIEIDGEGYYVWEFIHKNVLGANETTYPMVRGFYMDQRVNNDDNGYFLTYEDGTTKRIEDITFDDTVKVIAITQAVQAAGFSDPTAALDAGFGDVNATNAAKWFSDVKAPAIVDDAKTLADALTAGNNVVMTEDIDAEAETTAPYGNKVGFIQDGGVLDGGGNTLSVECNGDDYGIMTSGGTIKNLTIDSGCRAIMIMSPTGDIVVDKVNIGGDGVLYAINTGEAGADGVKLSVTNSTLAGWTSYGPVVESASFTNVKFEQGEYKDYASIYGRVLKPYVNTTLTDCSFIEHMNLDLSSLTEGHKVTFEDCTVNGQAVTADVFTPYSGDDSVYDTALFSVDLPSWADSIDDCITFN